MSEITFEKIHDRIAAGIPAANLAEAEAALDLLAPRCTKTPVMIALVIAEARNFRRNDKTFWSEAASRWSFPGDKTIYHYYAVGCLLIALREFRGSSESEKENRTIETQARRCYTTCLDLEFGKLAKLCTVMNDKRRGIVEVMNFLKLHCRKEWTNREFIRRVDELYGYGKEKSGNPDQLTFSFDIFDDVSPETVADVLERNPRPDEALQIVSNGALWCRSATRLLVEHADEFTDEALVEFERLSSELDEAKRRLDRVIAERRRAALALY